MVVEPAFELELPPGWSRARPEPAAPAQGFHLTSADGSYFSVYVEPGAGDVRGDAWWKIEARGDRLRIVEELAACRAEDDPPNTPYQCPAGDGVLQIAAGDVLVKGHYFLFWFGNERRETGVDLRPFRELLLSFRAR